MPREPTSSGMSNKVQPESPRKTASKVRIPHALNTRLPNRLLANHETVKETPQGTLLIVEKNSDNLQSEQIAVVVDTICTILEQAFAN